MITSPILILVSGLPCTGKTTLAKQIAQHFGYPLICKDDLKEILFNHFGVSDRDHSKTMSRATYQIMYHIAETMVSAECSIVMEANFHKEPSRAWIQAMKKGYQFNCFEVLCVTDREVLLDRFQQRGDSGKRHPGHLDSVVVGELVELLDQGEDGYLNLNEGFIKVDTTDFDQVNLIEISRRIDTFIQEKRNGL